MLYVLGSNVDVLLKQYLKLFPQHKIVIITGQVFEVFFLNKLFHLKILIYFKENYLRDGNIFTLMKDTPSCIGTERQNFCKITSVNRWHVVTALEKKTVHSKQKISQLKRMFSFYYQSVSAASHFQCFLCDFNFYAIKNRKEQV